MRTKNPSALLAISMLCSARMYSQPVPAATTPPAVAFFAQGTGEVITTHPGTTTSYGSDVAGATVGAYIQSHSWLGIETRAIALQEFNDERRSGLYLGPRLALGHRRFRIDAFVLGGASRFNSIHAPAGSGNNNGNLSQSVRPSIDIGFGSELRLSRRIFWRVGEVGYVHDIIRNDPSGITFSSGFVLRLH